ncbi:MAG TPA: hypothetical protein VFE53_20315 [Mucilaginibacter sp.]|jgi:hypothetical protein|nr:hypothetical protein [Mucilaginibacter sp.]
METIVLEVDDALAKAWKNSSPAERIVCENKINAVLRELQKTKFDNLLKKAGKIAADNGLTEDKLNELLKDDNDTNNEPYEWWNDEEMMAELDKSEADLRSGKDPGITWDALKSELLSRRKKKAN